MDILHKCRERHEQSPQVILCCELASHVSPTEVGTACVMGSVVNFVLRNSVRALTFTMPGKAATFAICFTAGRNPPPFPPPALALSSSKVSC